MDLGKRCFKIDKSNAASMIIGYREQGPIRHTSIWIDVKERYGPSLITFNRSPTRFKLSKLGVRMSPKYLSLPYKYVVLWVDQYFIRNDIGLWNTICRNGLFDIWDPEAPFDRLAESKTDIRKFRIRLVRIYEANREFVDKDIKHANTRIDHLIAKDRSVELLKPVIDDDEFKEIRNLLEISVKPYLSRFSNKSNVT